MDKQELNENSWKNDPITKARTVANIVSNGIDAGNYSELNDQLMELQDVGDTREQYVFEHPEINLLHAQMVSCISMSIIYALLLIMVVSVFFLSVGFRIYAGIGSVAITLILVGNIIWYIRLNSKKKFYTRYEVYYKVLHFKSIELVTDLAAFSKELEKNVINDLKRATEDKLIPQGHFVMEQDVFMVSDQVLEKYQEKKSTYDRYFKRILDERRRMLERTADMAKVMKKGEYYIEKIQESKSIIKDKNISQILDKMDGLVQMIFYELDVYPQQLEKLGLFLNYYLPTTDKLLEAYIDADSKQIKGKNLTKTKKEIERTLGSINDAFERTLDKFYQEKEIDIAGEIAALEIMMQQER